MAALVIPTAATMAACSDSPAQGANPGGDSVVNSKVPAAPVMTARQQADEMDAIHEAGVKAFPAATAGKGNLLMVPRMEGRIKVYDLTAFEIEWETERGKKFKAYATMVGTGPQIRVREGDRVRVVLKNELSIDGDHFHARIPNARTVCLTPSRHQPGETSRTSSLCPMLVPTCITPSQCATQTMMGCSEHSSRTRRPKAIERADVDYVMILNDGPLGYTLNGKGFPATEPIVVKRGQKLRIRYMNEGMMIHPMHLHGMHMTVIAKDGWDQPAPWKCDTLNIAPGERWYVIVDAQPRDMGFHCHILTTLNLRTGCLDGDGLIVRMTASGERRTVSDNRTGRCE